MAQETWLVIAVGAAFLLLGIAVSPLGWVALLQRRGRADRDRERSFDELSGQIRALKGRLERCEACASAAAGAGAAAGTIRPARFAGTPAAGADRERRRRRARRAGGRGHHRAQAHRRARPFRGARPAGDAQRAAAAIRRDLGPRGFRRGPRRHRPRDGAADRTGRADPGAPPATGWLPDQHPPCLP